MDDPSHCERVACIAAAVKGRPPGALLRVGKASAHTPYINLAGYGSGRRYAAIDVRPLSRILLVDADACLVTVEGGVEMEALCKALLTTHGLLPAVCPEGETFTVAGLVNGFGIQSSSHRFGLFHDIVTELEVVTGDGRIIRATESSHADLFAILPGSFGTLGLVTGATLRCMRATPRVRTVGTRFADKDSFAAGMLRALRGEQQGVGHPVPPAATAVLSAPASFPADPFPCAAAFIEGYCFGRDCYVLLETGFVHPDAGSTLGCPQYRSAPGDPYFYQYVRKCASAAPGFAFEQGTLDYVFRQSRGVWWLLEHYVGSSLLTGTRMGRSLFDSVLQTPPRAPQRGWQPTPTIEFSQADYVRCLVTQGFYVRQSRLSSMLGAVHDTLGILPLWTCPVRVFPALSPEVGAAAVATAPAGTTQSTRRMWHQMRGDGGAPHNVGWCLDIGCYGTPAAPGYRAFSSVRALQAVADSPSQWGLSYMTRAEMMRGGSGGVLNADGYAAARAAYGAEGAFPALCDKVGAYDPATAVDGPVIPCWRLRRDGLLDCGIVFVTLAAAAALLAVLYLTGALAASPSGAEL